MRETAQTNIPSLIEQHYQRLLDGWLAAQKRIGIVGGQITEGQVAEQSRRFLAELPRSVALAASTISPGRNGIQPATFSTPLLPSIRDAATPVSAVGRPTRVSV